MKKNMKKRKLIIISVILLFRIVCPVSATTYYVDPNGTADFTTIQAAINEASDGDKIYVTEGTYLENITLKNGVALIGAGASITTIDGGGAGSVVYSENCDQNTVLQGFTITNGNVPSSEGGGMHNFDSDPTVADCTFTGNTALYGGGMENDYSNPTIIGCTFTGNTAVYGGAMENYYSSPIVFNCTFSDNTALYGGGMDNLSGSPFVTDCTFSNNTAQGDPNSAGGGMSNSLEEGSTVITNPTVLRCIFSGNAAAYGGGMENEYRNPIVADCNFINNTTNGDPNFASGGGMYNFFSSPSVTACTFNNNTASFGGGISNEDSNSLLVNCAFIGNSADFGVGGGIENFSNCNSIITNCTFTGNSADVGGAMDNYMSNPTVNNSILWSNGDEIYNSSSDPSISYSNIQGCGQSGPGWDPNMGTDNGGNIDLDPLFLADIPDQVRLLSGSPCIDAGDNTIVPINVITDLDGESRFVDDPIVTDTGNGDGDAPIVDMGAYESDDPCLGRDKADFNCDGIVNMEDFADFASRWLQ